MCEKYNLKEVRAKWFDKKLTLTPNVNFLWFINMIETSRVFEVAVSFNFVRPWGRCIMSVRTHQAHHLSNRFL